MWSTLEKFRLFSLASVSIQAGMVKRVDGKVQYKHIAAALDVTHQVVEERRGGEDMNSANVLPSSS